MNLTERAISDLQKITGRDFGVSITLTAPNGQTVTVTGYHTKHNLGIDAEGHMVNSPKASVAISERSITEANGHYPMRNNDGAIEFTGHLVSVADSTGSARSYKVLDFFPDEKLALIVIRLVQYAG